MRDKITSICFLSMVFIISIIGIFIPDKVFSENENRYLKDRPEISAKTVFNGTFQKDYEEYVIDQLPGRDEFVFVKNYTEKLLGKKDTNNIYFAKDNYLIEKTSPQSIDSELANRNSHFLSEFVSEYGERLGREHVKVMLVPTAADVLSDKLPNFAQEFDQSAYIDCVYEEIGKDMTVGVRNILYQHNHEYVYYKTDHHWTARGAYLAYKEWAGSRALDEEQFEILNVSSEFRGTLFSKINFSLTKDDVFIYNLKDKIEFKVIYEMGESERDSLYAYEYLDKKDKYSVYLGGNHALAEIQKKTKKSEDGKKLLVIKDSYAHSFVPFAVNHYDNTFMVDLRYFNLNINNFIMDNGITDILFLYNAVNFATDKYIYKIS